VHDERDHSKNNKQVNQETAYVQDEECAYPENDQHHGQYEKHF
jgi:hypothetical protein